MSARMSHRSGPGPVPNRWLNCPRKSDTIIADRFLAFKTPLSKQFEDQVPVEYTFSPDMIFSYCKTTKLKLGVWIDLTNTKRFYDRATVEAQGIKYFKLMCRGHGETPALAQTQAFIEIVSEHISENPLDIIAVHCTHGFNRTGFLIASYLVERHDYSVETALSVFAKARPPGIYKQDYINELYKRYDDEDDAIAAPAMPDWCYDFDDAPHGSLEKRPHEDGGDDNCQEDEVEDNENSAATSNGNRKKKRRELVVKNPTFMAGVPGISLVTDQPRLGDLQMKVQEMCGWPKSGFPGAQPVSMDRKNIQRLHEIPYRVSWKADGTRYMMLINRQDEVYFFDRNHTCFQVDSISFVKQGSLQEHLEDTLLDGEMVLDSYQGKTTPRYLVYDIIKFRNRDIGKEPFYPHRLVCIKKEIIEPRLEAIHKGIINRDAEPFGVRIKDFWDIAQTGYLLGEKFTKTLLHEPDGLIFQPSLQPYTAGVCPDVLKWKPSEMNSIDFRLKISTESGAGILTRKVANLYVGGHDMPFAQILYSKQLKDWNNKIVECTVKNGKWDIMRERTDKTLPNSYNTAVAVVESIRNPVTKEYLLEFIHKFGYKDDHDKMPPPRAPPQHNHHHPVAHPNHGHHVPHANQQHA